MTSILKSLKNYNDETLKLSEHPVVGLDLEHKVTYLYGLGLIMEADEQIDESQKRFIGTLLKSFDLPEELLEEIEQNSQSIDDKFIEELKDTLSANNLVSIFFYDAMMVCFQDGNYCQIEKELIKQLQYLLNFNDGDISLVEKTIEAIDSRNKNQIESIEGEGYWRWKHLLDYNRIDYNPLSIKISNQRDLREFFDEDISYIEVNLGDGDFTLSEFDIEKIFSIKLIGSGIDRTTIWLKGNKNGLYDDESHFNDHSHEMEISNLNIESISQCKVCTNHSKLLVLTMFGDEILFQECQLEDVSEIDSFKKSEAEIEASMKAIEGLRDLL
ncbi:hypothetical protein WOB97_00730 [Vibrio parahaemolyticus]